MIFFTCVSSWEITEERPTSLPVPLVVGDDLRARGVRKAIEAFVILEREAFEKVVREDGDVAAAEAADEVSPGRVRRHHVLEIPAEQAAVEGGGRLRIGLAGVDPARDAGDVSVSLEHGLPSWIVDMRSLRRI